MSANHVEDYADFVKAVIAKAVILSTFIVECKSFQRRCRFRQGRDWQGLFLASSFSSLLVNFILVTSSFIAGAIYSCKGNCRYIHDINSNACVINSTHNNRCMQSHNLSVVIISLN